MADTLAAPVQSQGQDRSPYREAVITIQGGGIFGLSLLGQVKAVLEEHRYVPLALAGTSAGAIVAALLWSGMSPTDISSALIRISNEPDGVRRLLGPFDGKPEFRYEQFAALRKDLERIGPRLLRRRSGFGSKLRGLFSLPAFGYQLRGLVGKLRHHVANCGFFQGDTLEAVIETLLRGAPDLPSKLREKKGPLLFSDFRELMDDDADKSYRPPLLLTATNLTLRRLEIISSIDPRYASVPVSTAVRASAGFPVFFRPLQIRGAPEGGWYVDGGVVSNFPAWVFSDVFRKALEDVDPYRGLAGKPWIHIGLRVSDQPTQAKDIRDPEVLFPSLAAMLVNEGRNHLEDILASRARRSIIIQQPTSKTGAPGDALSLESLDSTAMKSMVDSGFTFADSELQRLGSPEVFEATQSDDLVGELRGLAARSLLCLQMTQEQALLRSNIFLPDQETLRLVFSYNMDGKADVDRTIVLRDQQRGLAGLCYTSRRPTICNLEKVRTLRQTKLAEYRSLFGLDAKEASIIRADRTWLACMPIFDPFELRFADGRARRKAHAHAGNAYHLGESGIDGPVLGVLCLDAGWRYEEVQLDPDPDLHFHDLRIQATLDLMRATAQSLAGMLAGGFPDDGGIS